MSLDAKLENLVKRLEQTTARLETLSVSQKPGLAPKPTNTSGNSLNAMSHETPASVVQFDDAVDEPLRTFTQLSTKIGGDVDQIANKFKNVFSLHREFVWYAAGTKEPDEGTLKAKLAPAVKAIEAIAAFKESKRNTPLFNHVSAVAEGVQAVFWVTVKKTPAPFVKDMLDASMFFVNRVRTEQKGKDVHQDWTKAWIEIFSALQKYVRQAHTTGLVWNSSPGAAPSADLNHGGPTKAPSAGGPPPPPPPPPADLFSDVKKSTSSTSDTSSSDAGRQALFAELNKGEDITKGLKKVSSEMQTHKNPQLRGQGPAPAKSPKPGATGAAGKPAAVDKPPKIELKDGKTWNVEYHKGNRDIVIQITEMKQCVYVFRCENSVVQIKGKVNSVTLDNCKKTSVVFDNMLSQIEVINCQSVEVQTLGSLPTISIQKTDGCQVYLSKESLDAKIVTSKSSEMNVLVPKGDEGDFTEFALPEQYETTVNLQKNKLETVVSDIA